MSSGICITSCARLLRSPRSRASVMRRRVRRLEGRKKRRKSDKKIPRFEDIFAKKAANPWFAVLGLEFPRDATQAVTKSDSVSDLGISSLETCGEKIGLPLASDASDGLSRHRGLIGTAVESKCRGVVILGTNSAEHTLTTHPHARSTPLDEMTTAAIARRAFAARLLSPATFRPALAASDHRTRAMGVVTDHLGKTCDDAIHKAEGARGHLVPRTRPRRAP